MPTPRQGYKNAHGETIPGTTTVIGQNLGWNKQQLLWWANQQGLAGKNHRDTATAAADIGTQAHAMVEAHIKGLAVPDGDPKAVAAFNEYLEWEKRTSIKIVGSEIALVSEAHQYGSTLDAMGEHEGVHELLDWKSSNGCYPDHVIQLAAYGENWIENHPDKPIRRAHLCRFGKEGGFHHHSWAWTDLQPAWLAFLHLRALHDVQKKLKGMV
jgi:hypothetical protein